MCMTRGFLLMSCRKKGIPATDESLVPVAWRAREDGQNKKVPIGRLTRQISDDKSRESSSVFRYFSEKTAETSHGVRLSKGNLMM